MAGARDTFRSRWQWAALMLLPCCISCSNAPTLNLVQGKVLYKDQPLKGVLVTLHPKQGADMHTILPTGLTEEDGVFKVTTGDNPGAAAGEYIVTFICSEEVPAPQGKTLTMGMGPEYADRFKGAYAEKSASKVEIEIKPGTNQLEAFRLK